MNHHHSILRLPLSTLSFKGIWDRASNIKRLHGDPFTAICRGGQFCVVDDVVCYDVLLDHACLGSHDLFQALTRRNEGQASVFVLSHVIALHNASVRHHEGHLNVLNDASVTLVIWQVSHSQLGVHLRNHCNEIVPEIQVILQGQTRDSALGDGENAAVVFALS